VEGDGVFGASNSGSGSTLGVYGNLSVGSGGGGGYAATAAPSNGMIVAGNVGIGTTSPDGTLHVCTDSAGAVSPHSNADNLVVEGSGNSGITIFSGDTNTGTLMFGDEGASSIGQFAYQHSTNTFTIRPNDSTTMTLDNAQNVQFNNYGSGTVVSDASGNLTISSDEGLKDIQGEFTKGLKEVVQLKPIDYKWKKETHMDSEKVYTGFGAQQVREFIPEAIGEDKDGILSLSDRAIIAALVNAVKELKEEIEQLKGGK